MRKMKIYLGVVGVAMILGACGNSNSVSGGDMVTNSNTNLIVDNTEKTTVGEVVTPEETTPEQTTSEQTTPEQTTSEQTTPEQTTPEQTTPEQATPEETTKKTNKDDIRPEFKEAMDSYEAFFDEYVTFMNKYAKSDNPLAMLVDYTKYMTKYSETMEKLDKVGDEDLTIAETKYYTEVMNRITQKLLTVGQ